MLPPPNLLGWVLVFIFWTMIYWALAYYSAVLSIVEQINYIEKKGELKFNLSRWMTTGSLEGLPHLQIAAHGNIMKNQFSDFLFNSNLDLKLSSVFKNSMRFSGL